jgi:hypothetical protein
VIPVAGIDDLVEIFADLARPYLVVEARNRAVELRVVSPAEPTRGLMSLALQPVVEDLDARRSAVIQAFDEFNDLVARVVDRATTEDEPLELAQQIYNKGVMMNSHGWVDVFDFTMYDVDSDIAHWAHRTY